MHVTHNGNPPAPINSPVIANVVRDAVGENFEATAFSHFDVGVLCSCVHDFGDQFINPATDLLFEIAQKIDYEMQFLKS
jgi:hypothetical protein